MVTGFNTDVKHDGKVYHVQTEDKGIDNPIIETLIYVGGEILAARRSSYADVLGRGVEEKAIAERIEAQHNRMILDIREGKYDNKRHRPFGEGIISSKSFDEVVLAYLRSLAAEDRIALQMVDSTPFMEGETASFDLLVSRVTSGQGVVGARVKVNLISTVDKPKTLLLGETGDDGLLKLSCTLPVLEEGTAALIIQAMAGKETAEIKQLIRKPVRKAAS
jgi:hypothetical protein